MTNIIIPGSKSISNRLLMIKAIGKLSFDIHNLSDADDTTLLQKALSDIQEKKTKISVGHAGTTFRFLCAYLSALENCNCILEGSEQLHARPVYPLVEALQKLGANINYLGNYGYPPLQIRGKKLNGGYLEVDAQISSQFISALMLISPLLNEAIHLKLKGKTVSASYIKLTEKLMHKFGVPVSRPEADECLIEPKRYQYPANNYVNESDWSGAGYFYAIMALNKVQNITLNGLFKNSIQPDAVVCELFAGLGVETSFTEKGACIKKIPVTQSRLQYDFTLCPDLAQTMAVCCAGMGIPVHFTGLSTLIIKETNRLLALQQELAKIGVNASITSDSISFEKTNVKITEPVTINTYHDHRMAMCFAPLAMLYPQIRIDEKEVVSKSFPGFWFEIDKIQKI